MPTENKFLPALRGLSQNVALYTEQRKAASKEYKYLVLGAKLSEDIMNAKNVGELSEIMIEGNQAAYMAGVPELSNQINNLGRIQLSNIQYGKEQMLLDEKNRIIKETVGSMPTIYNGKYIKMADLPEFESGKDVPKELQEMYYTGLLKQHATETLKTVGIDEGMKPYYREVGYKEATGEMVVKREVVKQGTDYRDLVTNQLVIEPPEITEILSKMNIAKWEKSMQMGKEEYMMRRRLELTPQEIVIRDKDTGKRQTVIANFKFDTDENGNTRTRLIAPVLEEGEMVWDPSGRVGFKGGESYNTFDVMRSNKYEIVTPRSDPRVQLSLLDDYKQQSGQLYLIMKAQSQGISQRLKNKLDNDDFQKLQKDLQSGVGMTIMFDPDEPQYWLNLNDEQIDMIEEASGLEIRKDITNMKANFEEKTAYDNAHRDIMRMYLPENTPKLKPVESNLNTEEQNRRMQEQKDAINSSKNWLKTYQKQGYP